MRRWLLLVLGVALALRLLAIADSGLPLYGDPADYDRIALSLAQHGTFADTGFAAPGSPQALRPPAYPVLLAGVYAVAGHHPDAARVVGALLGTLSVLLLYRLATELFDRRTALAAAAVAAVAPPMVWISASLLSETLAVPLVLGTALLIRRRSWLAGGLLGLAVLTRTNTIVLAVPLLLALPRRQATAALAGTALALAPWTIRNAVAFHRFLPLGTQSGYTMAGQWNGPTSTPGMTRAAWRNPESVFVFRDLFGRSGLDEGDVDAALRHRALDYAVHHPKAPVVALALNTMHAFDLGPGHAYVARVSYREMGIPAGRRVIVRVGTYLLLAFAAAGLLRVRAPPALWLIPVLLEASVVLWLGAPRYTAVVDPFLALMAGVALSRVRPARVRRPGAGGPTPPAP